MEHTEKVITDIKNRRIILGCTCGWRKALSLLGGTESKYADASAWTSHFDFNVH
jgi:hypothetical protein